MHAFLSNNDFVGKLKMLTTRIIFINFMNK